jgi:NAD(P)-dependent dehydrogenase (short-subunit alcohol dehydrogenase family)
MLSAVVTGASKGIGFAICRQLLQHGVSVVLTARSKERGLEALAKLKADLHPEAVHLVKGFVELDVTDEDSVRRSVEPISKLVDGRLDILVNNAGIAFLDETFGAEEALATVNTNTLGTIRVTRALMPLLEKASRMPLFDENNNCIEQNSLGERAGLGARIVNVASIESSLSVLNIAIRRRFTDPKLTEEQLVALMQEYVDLVRENKHKKQGWRGTMYHASKVGQMAFTHNVLAKELTSKNSSVTVASCCPGFCRTDMSEQCYGEGSGEKSAAEGADTPVWLAMMKGTEEGRKSHGGFYTERVRRQHGY